jgi:Protein of unknown function (DUF3631)
MALSWNDLAEFFAAMNASTGTPLPTPDSNSWEKHCRRICQLHAAMGSPDKDGRCAQEKLVEQLGKRQLTWWGDLPAILATDWAYKNPISISTGNAQASGDTPDFSALDFILALLEDYVVNTLSQRMVIALWVLHTSAYDEFEFTPRLGLISPDSGYGKTQTLKLLKQLIFEVKLTKNTTAPAMYRRLERWPNTTYLLDEGENQPVLTDAVMRAVIDGGYERGGTIDRADGEFPVYFPCAYAIRGSEYDVPLAIRSRSFSIHMTKGTPKKRFDGYDPAFVVARELIQKWKATASLNPNPEIPTVLVRDPRMADNCRPLLAVADTLGPEHSEAARAALIELCADFLNQGPAHRALNACKAVCDTLGDVDRIEGKALARGVIEADDYFSDWRGVNDKGQPHEITSAELSRLLKRFGVRSRSLFPLPRAPDSKSFRGYMRSSLETAWRVHCSESETPTHSSKIIALAKR